LDALCLRRFNHSHSIMCFRFCILGSGSSGNAALLHTEGARVLIDAGFSVRKLSSLLAAVGESLDRIDAIFLSHEHGDHAAAIEGLKKYPGLQIFANAATARAIQSRLETEHRPDWQIFQTGARFRFRDLEIETFAVPHDAQEPVGFRFTTGHDGDLFAPRRSLAYLTDLGHAPQNVREQLRECEIVVVESNHCATMLQADTKRPWSLKQRISGRHGHLSNTAARDLLAEIACPRWRRVYLTHLSRDCNSPAVVEAALAPVRALATLSACEFHVIAPGEGAPFYELV
jgi:phosphoribosyl 1,2-cyclic phosphodiesterase